MAEPLPLPQNRCIVHQYPSYMENAKLHLYEPKAFALSPFFAQGSDTQLQPLVARLLDTIELQILDIYTVDERTEILNQFVNRLPEIRRFYAGPLPDPEPAAEGVDLAMAKKMMKGACLLLRYMEMPNFTTSLIQQHLGSYGVICFQRDFVMLGNQIPLWLITLLRPLENCQDVMRRFFGNRRIFVEGVPTVLPLGDGINNMPIHYLHALHLVQFSFNEVQQAGNRWEESDELNRSATELVSKGVRILPCPIRNVWFAAAGELYLANIFVNSNFEVLFSNLIAFEISPGATTTFGALSYLHFLKSLLQNNDDVNVLKEAEILCTIFSTNNEVVEAVKSIETFKMSTNDRFRLVKRRINRHCRSKPETWMAELKKTHFSSPWSVIALFTAFFVIGLYLAQTVFAYLSLKK